MPDGSVARALVLDAPRSLVAREFRLPDIGADDALVRVEACGLCGTDHEQYTGELSGGFAFVPGHETVGTIEVIGARAAQRWGVSAGDRVAVEVFQSCRQCAQCLSGEYRRCIRHGLADMYGFIPADRPPGLWGGYAEYQYLAPDSMVLPVSGDLRPEVATLFNPLGAGIRWGATVPGTKTGDVVAVLGPGIRGLCAAAAAKEAGAGFVLVTGAGPRDAERLALAAQFGADLAVDVTVEDPVAALSRATGGLADVVVDVTAKAPAAFAQAIALARPAGTVVVAGTRGFGSGAPGFSPDVVVVKELRVIGALGVDTPAYRAALDLLRSGRYPFESVPRRCVRFEAAEDLLATMAGERDALPPIHGVLTP
ncbi:zinc-dependent alcohol dehydrogenase [Mycobacterium szulgai]|uniref:Alcohol dehydrogenase n=1 Tax=Mycobacterium szulgai TaxID=1787 RepID=A0A1X2DP25_MYCSZ|nr:zinc-binding dehydrogenase [Mycobacterium szulgai]MCV7074669.1 alcohol dehydrogenase catalytic domain-containing protein [Mycobacterium szulgai]ORW89790.1 alcohol dehydrogenase [Mycobacterium szulgai]